MSLQLTYSFVDIQLTPNHNTSWRNAACEQPFFLSAVLRKRFSKKGRKKQWFFPLKLYFWKNIGREQWAVWQFFCCVSFPRCFCKKSRISCTLWFKGLMCKDSPQQWGEEPQFPATGSACWMGIGYSGQFNSVRPYDKTEKTPTIRWPPLSKHLGTVGRKTPF